MTLRSRVLGAYNTGCPVRSQEVNVDFDPDDARQFLEGVDYPASKEDLISAAEANGAPDTLVDRIGTLGRPEYSSSEDVVEELHASPQST